MKTLMLQFFLLACFVAESHAKIYGRCELAQVLKMNGLDGYQGYSLANCECSSLTKGIFLCPNVVYMCVCKLDDSINVNTSSSAMLGTIYLHLSVTLEIAQLLSHGYSSSSPIRFFFKKRLENATDWQ